MFKVKLINSKESLKARVGADDVVLWGGWKSEVGTRRGCFAGGGDWYTVQSVCWVTSARGVSWFNMVRGPLGEPNSAEKSRALLALGRSKLAPLSILGLSPAITGCASSLASLVGGLGIMGEGQGIFAVVAMMWGRSGRKHIKMVRLAGACVCLEETGTRGRTPSKMASPPEFGVRADIARVAVAIMELPWQR